MLLLRLLPRESVADFVGRCGLEGRSVLSYMQLLKFASSINGESVSTCIGGYEGFQSKVVFVCGWRCRDSLELRYRQRAYFGDQFLVWPMPPSGQTIQEGVKVYTILMNP